MILTVILANVTETYIAVVHENQSRPYGRRTVQVPLTADQQAMIAPRETGMISGEMQREIVLESWLEAEPTARDAG